MSSHILKEVTGPLWHWHLAPGLLGGVCDLLIHFCGYLNNAICKVVSESSGERKSRHYICRQTA